MSCARSSTWSRATDTCAPEAETALAPERTAGILGGSFNPPHLGHLRLARHARDELGLACVALMPAHAAAHKPAAPDPGPAHRLRMCELLVQGVPGLSACALEVCRGGVSYTVDTLSAIHASNPDAQLTFIVGADTACTLGAWREPVRLLELAELAVAGREGAGREQVLRCLRELAPAGVNAGEARAGGARVRFLKMAPIDVSSSQVRERAARGAQLEHLVGAGVARYIAEQRLYRTGKDAAS